MVLHNNKLKQEWWTSWLKYERQILVYIKACSNGFNFSFICQANVQTSVKLQKLTTIPPTHPPPPKKKTEISHKIVNKSRM